MLLEQLRNTRAEALEAMKTFNDANATMTPEQVVEFTALQAKFDKANRDVKLEEAQDKLRQDVEDIIPTTPNVAGANAQYTTNFDNYLAGQNMLDAVASMTEGIDVDGGYIVPESYQKTVVMKLNTLSATRSISTVIGTDSTRNIPTEGDAPTFEWVEETGAYGETKTTFGNKQLGAWKLGGIIKVSEELLQDNKINFDSYMAGQIARGIDKAEAPAFAVGDGVSKPKGYVISSPVGASSTTSAVDAVTADELIDIYYDLKEEYRQRSKWRMTDKTEKEIRKLKDSDGNYLYGKALAEAERATLLGRAIVIDNSMPEMGAGNKFIVLGDFASFQIGDRGSMSVQRLNELYAGNGMVGFKVHKRVDAKVIIEEAFNAGKNADE